MINKNPELLDIDDAVVSGVHQIANTLNRGRGYVVSIPLSAVSTVLEAFCLLANQCRASIKDDKGEEEEETL